MRFCDIQTIVSNLQTALRELVAAKMELETRLLMFVTSGSNWGAGEAIAKEAATRTVREDLMKSMLKAIAECVEVNRTDEED